MWWNKSYINRRDWILENLGALKLSANQTLILLMIDFMNEQGQPITLEDLAGRCAMDVSEIDTTIHDLIRGNMLSIKVQPESVKFVMDGLFQDGISYEYVNESIFAVFEGEFGRLLSQNELMMLNGWLSKYQEEEILDALRSAMVYKKVSMNYINSILANKMKEQQGV
ncbi:DnaD domain protein [Erysipelothrix sp. HDW6C]|uniref:DnaD domain-containing protein n=1 Tax=Erysipelothrix sp. HDW6C TaxID=2714930 RepID=UPI001409E522|nr:DnaD domain protein [Erysipelothrix sp. HDW6C]QIK69983.1 DnaD domain protein [Erysipelothrix sp. HDW6C]